MLLTQRKFGAIDARNYKLLERIMMRHNFVKKHSERVDVRLHRVPDEWYEICAVSRVDIVMGSSL